jgi:putative ABC transport system permease protein
MTFPDVIDLGLSNLRQARLRTALTTIGVAIGVSALVGMVSLGQGLQDNLNARLLKVGFFQTIVVFPRFGGNEGPGGTSQPPRILDETAMLAIRQIPGVRRVEPDIRLFLTIESGDKKTQPQQAVGVPAEAGDETIFQEMPYGKFFSSEEAYEVILNTEIAKTLGFTPPGNIIGHTVKAVIGLGRGFGRGGGGFPGGGRQGGQGKSGAGGKAEPVPPPLEFEVELKVVGLTERERAVFGNAGSQIYIPFKMAQENQQKFFDKFPMLAMLRPPGFQGATVHLKSARDLESVEKTITSLGFRTISIASAISQLRRVFLIVDMLLAFVGSIGLAVACLGITNTMVMAVLERTREIGVMKAVGAEDQDIRFLFLAESAVIGALGGVIGLIFAWLLGRAINTGANFYFVSQGFQKENLFTIPLWLIGGAMVFSILVSIMSGLYPADRAARIDPTRALRHD